MNLPFKVLLPVAFSLLFPALGHGATIHVPTDYSTIQAAIIAAADGDTVLVAPGTYVENIDFLGKAITVTSSEGAEATMIDGGNPQNPDFGSVVTFNNGEGTDSRLQGFTITNGSGTLVSPVWPHYCGGGIFCDGSSPTLSNNTITCNWAGIGGGIYCCSQSSPNILNNTISKNDTWIEGAGISCSSSSPIITNNTISNNTSDEVGGIYCTDSSPIITNNVISNNKGVTIFNCNTTGGIRCYRSSATITNNVIIGNEAQSSEIDKCSGGGIYIDNFMSPSGSVTIKNNIISGNLGGSCAGAAGGIIIYESGPSLTIMNNFIIGNKVFGPWAAGGILFCYSGSSSSPALINNTIINNRVDDCASGSGGVADMSISNPTIINSILWGNEDNLGNQQIFGFPTFPTVTYSNIRNGYPGTGNIDSDPLFLDPGHWDDNGTPGDPWDDFWVDGDYHLTFNSPCRGSGNNAAPGLPETDFEGDPRVAYGTADMGADEFFTHLYWTGDAVQGGAVELKFTGLPGTQPVFFWLGSGALDPPLPTPYGLWRLQFPVWFLDLQGGIPSPDGVCVYQGAIPPGFPPQPVFMQALIGVELTNLCVMEVE